MGDSTSENPSTHLVVIIDICPGIPVLDDETLNHWLNCVVAFANSHLLMNESNGLTVIASNFDKNCYIYPPQNAESYVPKDGQHETFLRVSQEVSKGLVRMASEAKASLKVSHRASSSSSSSAGGKYGLSSSISKFPPEPLLSGALALALCKINRCKEDYNNSRIAILTPSSDNAFHLSSQYMNFMNAFFTAQKMDVLIDAVTGKADGEESILRQGCDISGGHYLSIVNIKSLLQFLMWVLLPDRKMRQKLVLPQKVAVGSKAACFCHRTLIDIGYVCSVCLSIRYVPHVSTTGSSSPSKSPKKSGRINSK